jgi:sugar phosphate isomerase/epimerase
MFTLSAFADEISPDPRVQVDVLKGCGVRHIEFRSIHTTNVLALSDAQLGEFKTLLDGEGFKLSAVGSPVGKLPVDRPLGESVDKLDRAIAVARRFGTRNVRVFSFYPPADAPAAGDWAAHRGAVMDRMMALAERAAAAGVTLLHENEHRIYGDSPDRVLDVVQVVDSPALRLAYDAANYVFCGYDPLDAWHATKEYTAHLHIKDWKGTGEESHTGVIPGTGDGRIPQSIADAVKRGYVGYAVLEPHLRGGGPTGGVTGYDLFPLAVAAFKRIVDEAGGRYD